MLAQTEGTIISKVVSALTGISDFFIIQAKKQYVEYVRQERNLGRSLAASQKLLESHPGCSWLLRLLESARHDIFELEDKRDEFRFHRQ